jgi:hypothetical protein
MHNVADCGNEKKRVYRRTFITSHDVKTWRRHDDDVGAARNAPVLTGASSASGMHNIPFIPHKLFKRILNGSTTRPNKRLYHPFIIKTAIITRPSTKSSGNA